MISLILQLNYMPLPAQPTSCVLQAVAHDYVNTMCSCDQPSEEVLWEASSSCRAGRHFICSSAFMDEEGEGTRGRNIFVCL